MHFLFHPRVTMAALATSVVSVCTAVLGVSGPLSHLLGPTHAASITDVALLVSPFATLVAAAGRSIVPAVDAGKSPIVTASK